MFHVQQGVKRVKEICQEIEWIFNLSKLVKNYHHHFDNYQIFPKSPCINEYDHSDW